MSGVFLNYRSHNSGWAAELLMPRLAARLGDERVFLDNRMIKGGQSFGWELWDWVRKCEVLLPIIGRDWLDARSPTTGRGIADDQDYVRDEIVWAIDFGKPIVPILLDGASPPRADQLPPEIAELAYQHGMPLRRGNDDLEHDLDRIVDRVVKFIARPRCPYPGIVAFGVDDARYFFGRDDETATLGRLLEENPVVVVSGGPGVGKSSLVNAGLAATKVPLRLVPGRTPEDLVRDAEYRAAAKLATPDSHVVVVVDQFEELAATNPRNAVRLFDLVHELTAREERVRAVFTMRGSNLDLDASPAFTQVLNQAQLVLGSLSEENLAKAIVEPAKAAGGFRIEPGLVDDIIADARQSPGKQYLVECALERLWNTSEGELTRAAYKTIGGVSGALSMHADKVYEREDDKDTFERLLTRLVQPVEGHGYVVSPVRYDELDAPLRVMATKLSFRIGGRLIVIRSGVDDRPEVVALAHAGLADHWKPLKTWLGNDREFHAFEHKVRQYRSERVLLPSKHAGEAKEYLKTRGDDFLPDDRDYLRRNLRRRRWFRVSLALLMVLTVAASIVAFVTASTAFRLRDMAMSRTIASTAHDLSGTNPALAAQLSLGAYRLSPTTEARSTMLRTFAAPYSIRLTGPTNIVESVAIHGDLLAVGSQDRRVRLWDIGDPYRPTRLDERLIAGSVWSVAFSPDGGTLAVASADYTTHLLDVSDPRDIVERQRLKGHNGQVTTLAYGPDGGDRVLLATSGVDHTVRLWDVTDPNRPDELPTLPGHRDRVWSVAISPDGRTMASASLDGTVRRWDVTDPAAPVPLPTLDQHAPAYSVSFSPERPIMATAGENAIRVWDITDPRHPVEVHTVDQREQTVSATTFSSDGTTLSSVRWDGAVDMWNVTDPRHLTHLYRYRGHERQVTSVAFASTGSTLVTGSSDKTVRLWDPPPAARVHTGVVFSTDLDETGRLLATASADRTVRLVDPARPFPPLATIGAHKHNVDAVTFHPKHRVLATASFDGTAILWDTKNPRQPRWLSTLDGGHRSGIVTAAFTPDGLTLATGSFDGTVRLWDVSDPTAPKMLLNPLTGHPGQVTMLTISKGPNESTVAAVLTRGGGVQLWDITNPNRPSTRGTLPHHDADTWGLAVSPDGRRLATASDDRTVRLWDISDPLYPRLLDTLTHNNRQFLTVAFGPDGRTLAVGSTAGTIDLVDVDDTGHLAYQTLLNYGHNGAIMTITYGQNGRTMITGSTDTTVRVWDLDPERVAAHICEVAYPPITDADWARYAAGAPFTPPCPTE